MRSMIDYKLDCTGISIFYASLRAGVIVTFVTAKRYDLIRHGKPTPAPLPGGEFCLSFC